MKATRDERQLPWEALPVLKEIKRHGFGDEWDYVTEARLPDLGARLQVRGLKNQVLKSVVKRYKDAYQRGDAVPPPVVTADMQLIDGGNRTEGARAAGLATIGLFRIRINYHAATSVQKEELVKLGGALNNMHGQGMSKADNASIIRGAVKSGAKAKDIASDLHLDANDVGNVMAELKGEDRLAQLGIKVEGGIKPGHLRQFGWKDKQVTNPVMRAVAELVRDTNLSVTDTRDLFKAVVLKTEEAERLAVVQKMATDRSHLTRGEQTPRRLGYTSKMNRALGALLALEGDVEQAVERDARYMDERASKLRRAISILEKQLHFDTEAQRAVTSAVSLRS